MSEIPNWNIVPPAVWININGLIFWINIIVFVSICIPNLRLGVFFFSNSYTQMFENRVIILKTFIRLYFITSGLSLSVKYYENLKLFITIIPRVVQTNSLILLFIYLSLRFGQCLLWLQCRYKPTIIMTFFWIIIKTHFKISRNNI